MYIKKTSDIPVLVDSNMRIVPEVLDFTRYLEKKEMSPNTIATYLEKLCVFYKWMDQKNRGTRRTNKATTREYHSVKAGKHKTFGTKCNFN